MYDDDHDDRLEYVEQAASLAVLREAARKNDAAVLCVLLPLVAVLVSRGLLALAGVLALRGTSQFVAVVVLVAAAVARMSYLHRSRRHADADVPRRWASLPPVWSWATVRLLVRRAPVASLAAIGVAHYSPWPAVCAAGAFTFLLIADLVVAKLNARRVQRMEAMDAFVHGGEKPTWEV